MCAVGLRGAGEGSRFTLARASAGRRAEAAQGTKQNKIKTRVRRSSVPLLAPLGALWETITVSFVKTSATYTQARTGAKRARPLFRPSSTSAGRRRRRLWRRRRRRARGERVRNRRRRRGSWRSRCAKENREEGETKEGRVRDKAT